MPGNATPTTDAAVPEIARATDCEGLVDERGQGTDPSRQPGRTCLPAASDCLVNRRRVLLEVRPRGVSTTSCWASRGIAKKSPSKRRILSFLAKPFFGAVSTDPPAIDDDVRAGEVAIRRPYASYPAEESLPQGRYSLKV